MQWNRPSFLDKEISLSQPKPPSPYFAGLASRRNVTGTAGGGSTPASSSGTSTALCLVAAPQSSSPRPWPHCMLVSAKYFVLVSLECACIIHVRDISLRRFNCFYLNVLRRER